MRATIAIAIGALLALGGAAAAEDDPPGEVAAPPTGAARPSYMWTVGGLLRATSRDGGAEADVAELEAYGYDAEAAVLTGLRGDLAWLDPPIVDLGVAWAWGQGSFAQLGDADEVTGSTLELGAFARVHWVKPSSPVAAEPRVEVGVARSSVDLRGASIQRVGLYTRLGLDVRIGGKRGGALLSIDHTSVRTGDDAMMDLPTGGVTVALSFYWRHWR